MILDRLNGVIGGLTRFPTDGIGIEEINMDRLGTMKEFYDNQ